MKDIFDRFECERLDDEYSYYQCIKEQKTGSRVECRECPEGQEHKEYFRRQHAAKKAKSEEAKGMNKCKACPECGKQATSNVQRTCECGHQFYTGKIGGGKTVVAKKKEPKAQSPEKPSGSEIGAAQRQQSYINYELSFTAKDKEQALKIIAVAIDFGYEIRVAERRI